MARLGRYFLPDQPLHVIQRGNNRGPIFFAEEDRAQYHGWLADAAHDHGCTVHAYIFMTNHVHLLVTPRAADSLPRVMQSLGRRDVHHVNALHRRTGTLWEGRYRAAPIDSDAYFLACCRYIENNPVRARMVASPGDYRWSSYHAHGAGMDDRLVSPHPLYDALGATAVDRQTAYRALFDRPPNETFIDALRAATNGGWALGDTDFKARIAAALDRRVDPLPRGRPAKEKSENGELFLL